MRNITQLFKALADPTRIRIIWLLQSGGELCVCDLVAVLALPQSTISRHLACLRNAGLVHDQRRGVWMYYRLPARPDAITAGLLDTIKTSGDHEQASGDRQRLTAYLANKKADACANKREQT